MDRLLIILMAFSLVSSLTCECYAADKVTQETKGLQSSAIYAPGGTVNSYNIYNEIHVKFTSKEFEQELERAPIDVRGKIKYLFNAGILAADGGLYPEAIDHLNNSIKIYPTVSAYIKLSYSYMRLTMYGKAEEAFFAARALSVQRDLKPFEEILNNEFLKLLVVYFQPLIEEIKREKGDFVFFGFFETECQWRMARLG
jgi:tetratricopeptide (TPR) repeat protein